MTHSDILKNHRVSLMTQIEKTERLIKEKQQEIKNLKQNISDIDKILALGIEIPNLIVHEIPNNRQKTYKSHLRTAMLEFLKNNPNGVTRDEFYKNYKKIKKTGTEQGCYSVLWDWNNKGHVRVIDDMVYLPNQKD